MGFFNDTFQSFKNYFDMSDSDYEDYSVVAQESQNAETPTMRLAPSKSPSDMEPMRRSKKPVDEAESDTLRRLNTRQRELMNQETGKEVQTTIDIKFPKRYEDAPEIVNLLLENTSVLIDFQYMAENQARRCLDYLDGARSVLAGNLKKVSSTMWLLTPVNVTVNIEELRSSQGIANSDTSHYDFDMRR